MSTERAELRGSSMSLPVDVQDLLDAVDDDAGVELAAGLGDLDDDDAGLLGDLGGLHAELGAQIHDRDDLAAQVDDALDVARASAGRR